ncbi:hypothetical protein [Leisingera sp.]|nr:hypothetical protein [Leisingera sp.]
MVLPAGPLSLMNPEEPHNAIAKSVAQQERVTGQ